MAKKLRQVVEAPPRYFNPPKRQKVDTRMGPWLPGLSPPATPELKAKIAQGDMIKQGLLVKPPRSYGKLKPRRLPPDERTPLPNKKPPDER